MVFNTKVAFEDFQDPTERQMQEIFYSQYSKGFECIVPNWYAPGNHGFESDLFCLRKSGHALEIEIKRTLSDFRADAKKDMTRVIYDELGRAVKNPDHSWALTSNEPFHKMETLTKYDLIRKKEMTNSTFAYLVPQAIVEKVQEELPEFAGLFYLTTGGRIIQRVNCPRNHKKRVPDTFYRDIARNICIKYWYKKSPA